MKNIFLTITLLLSGLIATTGQTIITFSANQAEKLQANAGNDTETTSGESVRLGENPTTAGGTEPYSYAWSNSGTEVSTEANPLVNPEESTSYILLVTDNVNCTSTDTISISIVTTALDDFTHDELKVFPNPATDKFTIDYLGENFTATLIDMHGNHLWTKTLSEKTSFPAPGIPGTYLLKINANGRESVRRIVVSK